MFMCGRVEIRVWMGVGRSCSPVRNNIVTLLLELSRMRRYRCIVALVFDPSHLSRTSTLPSWHLIPQEEHQHLHNGAEEEQVKDVEKPTQISTQEHKVLEDDPQSDQSHEVEEKHHRPIEEKRSNDIVSLLPTNQQTNQPYNKKHGEITDH